MSGPSATGTGHLALSTLLSRCLAGLDASFARAGAGSPEDPSLAMMRNVLRSVTRDGGTEAELATRASVSRRALRTMVTGAAHAGWITTSPSGRRGAGQMVRLTDHGSGAQERWPAIEDATMADWHGTMGVRRTDQARRAAAAIVGQLDLEWSHHPVSYGGSDPSVTGAAGSSLNTVTMRRGPARTPRHDQPTWCAICRRGNRQPVRSVVGVFSRPAEVTDSAILQFVTEFWSVDVDTAEYAPVGFGSHHWLVGTGPRWKSFITVHDLRAKALSSAEPSDETFHRLWAAFTTARDLADAGHSFVLAPDLSRDGDVVHRLNERFTVACFPWVHGVTGDYGRFSSDSTLASVAHNLVDLHGVGLEVVQHCRFEDFEVPGRNEFDVAFAQLDDMWDGGPYAEAARTLLRVNAETVEARFARYDEAVQAALPSRDRWVVTHGEPHGSNVMTTERGTRLIDWDTTLVAPRERDVWHLDSEGAMAARIYSQGGGRRADADLLELYRLQWDLMEIAGYLALFHGAHEDSEDARESLRNLRHYIAPRS